jgi:hypothetical protein
MERTSKNILPSKSDHSALYRGSFHRGIGRRSISFTGSHILLQSPSPSQFQLGEPDELDLGGHSIHATIPPAYI